MRELEQKTGKGFGDAANPLLVSVRSGARVSMPGMMDTILNLGLNDETVDGLAAAHRQRALRLGRVPAFHLDVLGNVVLDIDEEHFDHLLDAAKERVGVKTDPELERRAMAQASCADVRSARAASDGRAFPQDVHEQLDLRDRARSSTRGTPSARSTTAAFNKIPDDWGTAVSVVSMVFGNMGDDSGTGVAFTRDPNTGERDALRRVPAQRTGRGRRGRHPHAPEDRRSANSQPRSTAVASRSPSASSALPRHAGPRVHGRARQALHAADA